MAVLVASGMTKKTMKKIFKKKLWNIWLFKIFHISLHRDSKNIEDMKSVKCLECGNDVMINIANAQDENGEVYMCPECGFKFRYTDK